LVGGDAAQAYEGFAELEKLATAGRLLVAPLLTGSADWVKQGHRSAEEWMAQTSGISVGEAKRAVETAERVAGLGATTKALRSGELSLAQVCVVAEAAEARPESEAKLLAIAGSESVRILKDRARQVVLEARSSLDDRYERQRKLRSFGHWIDDEGMVAGRFRLTPDVGMGVVRVIEREADRHFRQAYRESRRDGANAYAADALAALVTGEGLGPPGAKGTEVVVVVSHEALRRGFVDPDARELCEVPGFGAVPVSRARALLGDAFLKGVVHDGRRVTHVKHFGRHRPAEVDTALMVEAVVRAGSLRCSAPGCDRTVGLEWDHRKPFARGGPTSVENLQALCRFHHRLKTADRAPP